MFRIFGTSRRPAPESVRFCDGCGEISTAQQRAERRYDEMRTAAIAATAGLR